MFQNTVKAILIFDLVFSSSKCDMICEETLWYMYISINQTDEVNNWRGIALSMRITWSLRKGNDMSLIKETTN